MPEDQAPTDTNNPQSQDDTQITQPSALPQDNGTPAQAADDTDLVLGDAHQATDNASDMDSHEVYDDGVATAAGAAEPQDPGIASYSPPATDEADSEDAL